MNHPFIQMLKFEAKANQKMWIITTIISVVLLALTNLTSISLFTPFSLFLVYYSTLIFTLLSYQESTYKQSMNMYHLIPIDQNIKFFTKIVISLVAFPLLLLTTNELFHLISKLFIHNDSRHGIDNMSMVWNIISSQNMLKIYLVVWFISQSICTLLAIVFKKYKVLYALLVFYGLQIVITPIIGVITIASSHNFKTIVEPNRYNTNGHIWILVLLIVVSIVLYAISYILFKRRQI